MFVETQLRITLGLEQVRKTGKTPKGEKVIELAERALKGGIIDSPLHDKIRKFNTDRNDGVHNLSLGIITFEQLKETASQSSDLIDELQKLYVYIEIGSEEKLE